MQIVELFLNKNKPLPTGSGLLLEVQAMPSGMGTLRRRRNSGEYAGLLCSLLLGILLGRVQEDGQHCDGEDDAEGICNRN